MTYVPPTPKSGIMDIAPYVAGKAKAANEGRVIKLSSNENPWGPSPLVQKACENALAALHRYPDSAHETLRGTIGKAYGLAADQLICGAGSDELIGLLIHAYAGSGDEVLFSRHAFLMYKIYTLSFGATPVMAPEKNLTVDVDALLAHVTGRTKIVFLANPNNPTGTYVPYSEIKRLRENLPQHVILALDAAYAEYMDAEDYNTGHALVASSNTVVLHTASKIYGLPALRLGFAHAPAPIIDVLNRIRGPFNVNALALAAGIAAFSDQDYIATIRKKNAAERARVSDALNAFGYNVVPSYTNFVLAHVGAHADALSTHLSNAGIIVRDVKAYGLPEYLRISIGTEEENTLMLEAIKRFSASSAA